MAKVKTKSKPISSRQWLINEGVEFVNGHDQSGYFVRGKKVEVDCRSTFDEGVDIAFDRFRDALKKLENKFVDEREGGSNP